MLGTTLGGYRIESELGSGGMGKVYLARDEGGAALAVKVVHPHLLESPGFFKRFLREVEVGRAVRHPNVVRTVDCDAVGGHHFLVMEYVEGVTLRGLLDELGAVPEELCRHIGLQHAPARRGRRSPGNPGSRTRTGASAGEPNARSRSPHLLDRQPDGDRANRGCRQERRAGTRDPSRARIPTQ
jgi:serine/threonine protein kinase